MAPTRGLSSWEDAGLELASIDPALMTLLGAREMAQQLDTDTAEDSGLVPQHTSTPLLASFSNARDAQTHTSNTYSHKIELTFFKKFLKSFWKPEVMLVLEGQEAALKGHSSQGAQS